MIILTIIVCILALYNNIITKWLPTHQLILTSKIPVPISKKSDLIFRGQKSTISMFDVRVSNAIHIHNNI